MPAQPSQTRPKRKPYTALIHFHGIGEQRRYEELSFLIDALEEYSRANSTPLRDITVQSERARTDLPRDTVKYVRAWYQPKEPTRQPEREYRFYEAYYANLIAGGIGPIEVLLWLISLSFMPVRILFTRWRELPRLRRATWLGDWDQRRKKIMAGTNENKESQIEQLDAQVKLSLDVYDDFVRTSYPLAFTGGGVGAYIPYLITKFNEGRFGQYVKHLPKYLEKYADDHPHPDRVKFLDDARRWRWRFISIQLTVLLLVATALLTLGLASASILGFLWHISSYQLRWNLLGGSLILLVLGGLSWFLRNYVGDLYFWTTYQETSTKHAKREAILDYCSAYLSHVLLDDDCERVVLVAHSMGTTVAHDTLLRLARSEPSLDASGHPEKPLPLGKIQHFVTLASVIDKVYYLFETVISQSYRYNRIVEALRGDLGTFPFSEGSAQIPHIHWINFWDRADVASSRLYTPANHKFKPEHVVDNYEVAGMSFPDPVSAHLDYTQNPLVLRVLAGVFFENQANFVELTKQAKRTKSKKVDYVSVFFGSAERAHPATNILQMFVLLCPWLILLHWICVRFGPATVTLISWNALIVDIILIPTISLIDWIFRFGTRRAMRFKTSAPGPVKLDPPAKP